jgi:hypothetical protein
VPLFSIHSFQRREGNTFVGTIRLHTNSARGVWQPVDYADF